MTSKKSVELDVSRGESGSSQVFAAGSPHWQPSQHRSTIFCAVPPISQQKSRSSAPWSCYSSDETAETLPAVTFPSLRSPTQMPPRRTDSLPTPSRVRAVFDKRNLSKTSHRQLSNSTASASNQRSTVECSTWSAVSRLSVTCSELDHLFEDTETVLRPTADIDRELQELLAKEGDVKVDEFDQFVGARVPDGKVNSVRSMIRAQRAVVEELSHPPQKFDQWKEVAEHPDGHAVDAEFKEGVVRVHDKLKALKDQLTLNPTGHLKTDSETSFALMMHSQNRSR